MIFRLFKLCSQIKKNGTAFAEGDAVTAFGNKGVVKKISGNGMFVEVKFEDFPHGVVVFEIDGRISKWNKEPSLRKI